MIAANLAVDRGGRTSDWFYGRVMFPIHDERGRTIAFGGRILTKAENAPKYLNTRDTVVRKKVLSDLAQGSKDERIKMACSSENPQNYSAHAAVDLHSMHTHTCGNRTGRDNDDIGAAHARMDGIDDVINLFLGNAKILVC